MSGLLVNEDLRGQAYSVAGHDKLEGALFCSCACMLVLVLVLVLAATKSNDDDVLAA